MADQHTYKILPEDKCLTESQLFDYIDGKLKASDMHFIEKHILSCGFCSDALEGLEKVKDRRKVAAFIPTDAVVEDEEKKEKPKVIPLNPNRKYYAIAAGAVLILGISLFLKLSTSNDLAESKMAEVTNNKKSDSAVLMPAKDAQDKSIVAFVPDSLKKETDSRKKTENQQGPASGEVSKPDYFTMKATDEAEAADQSVVAPPAPKVQEPVQADKLGDMDDGEDFANVVDAKTPEEEQLAKTETAKEKPGKFTLAEKKNAANRSDNDNKQDQSKDKVGVASADVPVTITQPATLTPTSGSYTYQQPASTGTTTPIVSGGYVFATTDSMSTIVTKSERDLDLAYENANKMQAAGQTTASLALYDEVLKNPTHPHYQDAQWKKSEALIQLKRIDEAKKLLNEIAAKPGKYKVQATEKLKNL